MAICDTTGLSVSYSWKKGCRCPECRFWKQEATKKDGKGAERARLWRLNNLDRSREASKKYQRENPDKVLAFRVKKYGLTLEEYHALEALAESKCMCCRAPADSRLHIDHDHRTGKVRGLLCGACNVGLGHFKDDTTLLAKAIKYLKVYGDVG